MMVFNQFNYSIIVRQLSVRQENVHVAGILLVSVSFYMTVTVW